MSFIRIILAAGLVGWLAIPAVIQAQEAEAKPKSPSEIIVEQLRSKDPAIRQAGVEALRELAVRNPREFGVRPFLDPLLAAGFHEDLQTLALQAILHRPQADVAALQLARVRSLRRQGRHEEALAEAKSYYNVVSLNQTHLAIDLLAECLASERGGDDPRIVRRFKQQQVAGAQLPEAQIASDPTSSTPAGQDLGENILKTIKVDALPYAQAIERLEGKLTFAAQFHRGNLLLLADRPAEAQDCFELAYDLAKDQAQLTRAIHGIARAIRAEDGTIARANAYVLSLRH